MPPRDLPMSRRVLAVRVWARGRHAFQPLGSLDVGGIQSPRMRAVRLSRYTGFCLTGRAGTPTTVWPSATS